MKLFKLENWKVEIAPEALTIVDFKELVKRDKSKTKEHAINELSFIFFFCDSRSDYLYIDDPTERMEAIKTDLNLPKKWKPDELVTKAMNTYLKLSVTIFSTALDDVRVAIRKITQNLREADYKNMDTNEINKSTSSIKQVGPLLKEFKELEREVLAEIEEDSITSKDRTILDSGFKAFNDIETLKGIQDGN
jgi:hypothetical protein